MTEFEVKFEMAYPMFPLERIKIDFIYAESAEEVSKIIRMKHGELLEIIYIKKF